MKKVLLIILVAFLFVGCGYSWQKAEKDTQTVYILEVGNFTVDGDVEYRSHGRVEFMDLNGRTIKTHISNCVIVDTPFAPKAPQVQQPAPAPKKEPVKQPVETPKKVPNKGK